VARPRQPRTVRGPPQPNPVAGPGTAQWSFPCHIHHCSDAALTAALAAGATFFSIALAPSAAAVGETLSVTLTTADGSAKLAAQPAITLGAVTSGSPSVVVDDSMTSQVISGFGGSFTNSSTYLLLQLKAIRRPARARVDRPGPVTAQVLDRRPGPPAAGRHPDHRRVRDEAGVGAADDHRGAGRWGTGEVRGR
jgi:hypothetical protein